MLDLFHELVYVTRLFPHRNLCLEVPLVDIEEYRYPGHGRRRRWRRDDYQVADQRLVQIRRIHRFRTAYDLTTLLPPELPTPFHTGHLAQQADVPRWVAQRITYCLRKMGAAEEVGKRANTRLYQLARRAERVA